MKTELTSIHNYLSSCIDILKHVQLFVSGHIVAAPDRSLVVHVNGHDYMIHIITVLSFTDLGFIFWVIVEAAAIR
jgi:hypothetical protein